MLRKCAGFCSFFMWAFLGFGILMYALIVIGLSMNNAYAQTAEDRYNFVPMILAAVLMLAGTVLFVVLKKHRWVGVALALVAALMFAVITMDIYRFLPNGQVDAYGNVSGLTPWKLIYRHLSILLTPVFMLGAWLFGHIADKDDEFLREQDKKPGYDLSGAALFADTEDLSAKKATGKKKK